MAATFHRSGLVSSAALAFLCAASTTFAIPHSAPFPVEFLYPRADNTTSPTSTASTTATATPAPASMHKGSLPSQHGALAGTIIGIIGVAMAFVAIFVFTMRHRHIARRNKRNRIYLVPAVRAEMMNNYARDQEALLRASRSRSAGGSSSAARSAAASFGGGRPSGVTVPPRAARGPKRPVVSEDPPPSYYADRPPPEA